MNASDAPNQLATIGSSAGELSTDAVLEVLAKGSKSFSFAGLFLPPARRADAALLYAFCRYVDDVADDAPTTSEAREGLQRLDDELLGRRPATPLVAATLDLFERRGIDVIHALELIKGVRSDLDQVRFSDDRELLIYCYRVAGVVGLMMCGVLGVKEREALPFAIDLGIAMQLTNISRDVAEDAGMDRVYVPATRLQRAEVSPTPDGLRQEPERVGRVVRDLVAMADRYYSSAELGYVFIPWRTRFAIRVAARVYRAIGVRLVRLGCDPMAGRTVVPLYEKIWWALGAAVASFVPRAIPTSHRSSLHWALRGLPGAHEVRDGR